MTKFNPENKKELTYEEAVKPAMGIKTQADADQYLEEYVKYLSQFKALSSGGDALMADFNPVTRELDLNHLEIAKANIGYYTGYYNDETRLRVEKLFNCGHPIFGSMRELGRPTSKESFQLGVNKGKGKGPQTLKELRDEDIPNPRPLKGG